MVKRIRKSEHVWLKLAKQYGTTQNLWSAELDSNSRKEFYDTIRAQIFDRIWDEMKNGGENKPPFLMDMINGKINDYARNRGIRRIIFIDMEQKGMMRPASDGFDVFLSKKLSLFQLRSILAHEIGHTYFFFNEIDQDSHGKLTEWENLEGPVYEVARQLLVPKQYLLKVFKDSKVSSSIGDFNFLRNVFKVTRNILAKRLINDNKIWNVYMAWFYMTSTIKALTNASTFKELLYRKLSQAAYRYHGDDFAHMGLADLVNIIAPFVHKHLTDLASSTELLDKPVTYEISLPHRNRYLLDVEYRSKQSLITLMLKRVKETQISPASSNAKDESILRFCV